MAHAGDRRTHAELDRLIHNVKSNAGQAQLQAAEELRKYVASQATELQPEKLLAFQRMLNMKLQELFKQNKGSNDNGQIAGTLCISMLIDVEFMDQNLKITQFANYIYKALNTDNREQAELAAKTLGKLVQVETALTHDIVEAESKRCFEWMNDESKVRHRRYVGALIMRELVTAASHLLLKRLSLFLSSVWIALRDEDVDVRRVAATAFKALVASVIQKDSTEGEREFRNKSMERLFQSCMDTLQSSEPVCHGALLALRELYTLSHDTVLINGFHVVCESLCKLRTASFSPVVRHGLIQLLPILAKYSPNDFATHTGTVLDLLMYHAKHNDVGALTAIGDTIETMGGEQAPLSSRRKLEEYLPAIIKMVAGVLTPAAGTGKQSSSKNDLLWSPVNPSSSSHSSGSSSWFTKKKRESHREDHFDVSNQNINGNSASLQSTDGSQEASINIPSISLEALSCLKSLAITFPERVDLRRRGRPLLDAVFNFPVNTAVVNYLNETCMHLPSILSCCQEGMLSKISSVLLGGAVLSYTDTQAANNVVTTTDTVAKTEALRALQTLDMRGHDLTYFVASCCVPYLNACCPTLRREAAKTCLALLQTSTHFYEQLLQSKDNHITKSHGVAYPSSHSHKAQVLRILLSLVNLAVSDIETENRVSCLQLLDATSEFDPFLATPNCIQSLVLAVSDGDELVAQIAIKLVGRLSKLNPAYTLPPLRKVLLQLLTELSFSMDAQRQDYTATMLGRLIEASPKLIEPYVHSLIKSIFEKLSLTDNIRVHGTLLETLGQLSCEAGADIKPLVPKIVPVIQATIKDKPTSISIKQAVVAMGQIIQTTGKVAIFEDYPKLMDLLIDALQGASKEPFVTRQAVMRTFGIGGALDPHTVSQIRRATNRAKTVGASSTTSILISEPNYDTLAVINALLSVLESPSQQPHHRAAVQSLQMILRSLGSDKPIDYLPMVLPAFLKLLCDNYSPDQTPKIKDRSFAEFMFRAIAHVVGVVKQHIRKYLEPIAKVIRNFWDPSEVQVMAMVLNLCEEVRKALNEEFLPHLTWLVPSMIQIVRDDPDEERVISIRIMATLECFGQLLEGYLHLTVPCLIAACKQGHHMSLRIRSVRAIKSLCQQRLTLNVHAASIVHALTSLLREAPAASGPVIHHEAASCLEALLLNTRTDFDIFLPMLKRVLESTSPFTVSGGSFNPIDLLAQLTAASQRHKRSASNVNIGMAMSPERACAPIIHNSTQGSGAGDSKGPSVNPAILKRAWAVSGACAARDYVSWLSQFGQKLLQESPSTSLRAAFDISRQYPQLNSELFNVAFVSCYFDLSETFRAEMLAGVKKALEAENLPSEVLQPLLNLAEYMERCDRGGDQRENNINHDGQLMASFAPTSQLAALAEKCQLFAKALHYHETSVRQIEASMKKHSTADSWPPEVRRQCLDTCRHLVHINNCLELPQSSEGLLKYIQKHNLDEGAGLTAEMYVHLGWWEKALTCFEDEAKVDPSNHKVIVGMFECLDQMGDWPKLLSLAKTHWGPASDSVKEQISPMVGHAAWLMSKWRLMEEAVEHMSDINSGHASTTAHFYKAILAFHQKDHKLVQFHIDSCRELMDADLSTRIAESYSRAYELVVCLQQLSEMEEVISYSSSSSQAKSTMRQIWADRLSRMSRDPKYLQGTLAVRSLVVKDSDNLDSWLEFVEICRWSGKSNKAQQVLMQLYGRDLETHPEPLTPSAAIEYMDVEPRVVLEYLKHLWVVKKGPEGSDLLLQLSLYAKKLRIIDSGSAREPSINKDPTPEISDKIKAKILLTMTVWQQQLQANAFWQAPHRDGILKNLLQAIQLDGNGYRVWHEWALLCYRIPLKDQSLPHQEAVQFVTRAIKGFVRSISLCRPQELAVQDILRLLRVWFNFGADEQIAEVIAHEVQQVNVDMWLQVIPQIIARIDSSDPAIRKNINSLLCRATRAHPQAVTYPLVVCTNKSCIYSTGTESAATELRRQAAQDVLDQIRNESKNLIDQAQLVATELIRVAILWSEMWTDSIEEASRLYFGDHDPMGMIAVLEPLYEWLEHAETDNEKLFSSTFAMDLSDARVATNAWKRSKHNNDMTQAWDLYYTVFKRLKRQLLQMATIELQNVSPMLHKVSDFEVAVPGQYKAGQEPVRISRFDPVMEVIPSKQRPRKLIIVGSDGLDYKFLLKGHEDLRQDERVMQLFGLVNTLLRHDKAVTKAARADLSIDQYPVIPLSSNAGIIGWLDRAETFHALIRDYRVNHGTSLNVETKFMQQYAGEYDFLCLMQKVEVFEHALANTDGDDLHNILWLKATSSEAWLERRTNYTRSLATMSMVGYVLGLGDRHPSNLMLDSSTGKVIHIDFGDCFEVAMQRDRFPEKIPFRLTRMVVRAMEVSGIEGCFRRTAELVMGMLRRNKDSLMAMLEAFVHDPLISWRLDAAPQQGNNQKSNTNTNGGLGTGNPSEAQQQQHQAAFKTHTSTTEDRYSRSLHEKSLLRTKGTADASAAIQMAANNPKAVAIVQRIKQKLEGTEFQTFRKKAPPPQPKASHLDPQLAARNLFAKVTELLPPETAELQQLTEVRNCIEKNVSLSDNLISQLVSVARSKQLESQLTDPSIKSLFSAVAPTQQSNGSKEPEPEERTPDHALGLAQLVGETLVPMVKMDRESSEALIEAAKSALQNSQMSDLSKAETIDNGLTKFIEIWTKVQSAEEACGVTLSSIAAKTASRSKDSNNSAAATTSNPSNEEEVRSPESASALAYLENLCKQLTPSIAASTDVAAATALLQNYGIAIDAVGKYQLSQILEEGINGVTIPEDQRAAVTTAWNRLEEKLKTTTTGRARSATRIQSLFRGEQARKATKMRILLGEEADQAQQMQSISVPEQVTKLIEQATAHENLAQCYIGWCPFW